MYKLKKKSKRKEKGKFKSNWCELKVSTMNAIERKTVKRITKGYLIFSEATKHDEA